MKKKTASSAPVGAMPKEIIDENGDKISLVDKDGDPIEALSFLAHADHKSAVTENDRLWRKIRKYRMMSLCFAIAFACFLILFVMAMNSYNTKCQQMYDESFANANELLGDSVADDYDYDTKYREITAELNVIRKMSFSVIDDHDRRTTYNEIYFLAVKMPDEFRKYLAEIRDGFEYINTGYSEKGFATLSAVIEKTDILNY